MLGLVMSVKAMKGRGEAERSKVFFFKRRVLAIHFVVTVRSLERALRALALA